ncbi:MAG: TIGR03617 family F420-dependent LLM class oxidoreductase [Myxococcota bacterium]|nr:TIGR03617 family F420-dependent LLM class oxidoreductase [Myxococcota bacterium]
MFQVWTSSGFFSGPAQIAREAVRAEAMGMDCFAVVDSVHDGLIGAALAAQATERIEIATSALACFPRSPMTTAVAAWDLQALSNGRFRLGLGPLIAPIIVGKYSTPWSPPAPRMREYVQGLRAIFDCWQNDAPLDYRGEHYRLTLQQEYSKPGRLEHPDIPIHLAAIGPHMTALAGELADAVVPHPTNSSGRYIREIMLENARRGAARVGRAIESLEVIANPLSAIGSSREAIAAQREAHRRTLANIFSTPNYWPSLDLFGWHDVGERLNALVREGRWDDMPKQLSDEMLDVFVPSGHHEEIADVLLEEFGDVARGIYLSLPDDPAEDSAVAAAVARLQSA